MKKLCHAIAKSAVMVALLLTANKSAFAAPPTLTASANPVIVPATASSAPVTISWNTGTTEKGRVWLSVNGAAEKMFDPPSSGEIALKGARTQTVVPGSTYVFRLYSRDRIKLWKELTVTTTKAIFPTEEPGKIVTRIERPELNIPININRSIGNIKVEPQGTFADLSFTTADAAVPMILVSTQAPNTFKRRTPKGEKAPAAFNAGDVVSTAFPLFAGKQTSHKVRLSNLQPGTNYHFVVEAMGASGATLREKGTFSTLRRFVTVTFNHLHVETDGDYTSDGDLVFGFAVNSQHDPNGEDLVYGDTIESGKSRDFNVTATIADAPEELVIKVLCADDDEFEILPAFDSSGLKGKFNPYGWSNEGDTSDWEWQSVEGKYMLPTESTTAPVPFQLHAKGDDLEYTIQGNYRVQYMSTAPKIVTSTATVKQTVPVRILPRVLERLRPTN